MTDLGQTGFFWLVIAAMTAVNYAIRAGGFFLMGYVPLTPRVRAILNALPGAVVVAIVLPLMVFHQLQLLACTVIAGRLAPARGHPRPWQQRGRQ